MNPLSVLTETLSFARYYDQQESSTTHWAMLRVGRIEVALLQ
jgi:hypothetical protein